jgi:diacylglycerol kinase family enzyme
LQATLIYNPNSGGTDRLTPTELSDALVMAGYQPVYRATTREEDLDNVLDGSHGLVVVTGGDGTVRAVATRLIGRNIPLAIAPSGTANNIARALGIEGSPLDVVAGLSLPVRRYFDVGRIMAPWGEDFFFEAAGYGLYASTLAAYRPEEGKSVLRSIEALSQTLGTFEASHCQVLLDGKDLSGAYLLMEVLNTPAFGPRLKVAPEADPSDGLLEVLRIRDEQRPGFLNSLTGLLREELEELPGVELNQGRSLEICWRGEPFHVDGEVRPPGAKPPGEGEAGDRMIPLQERGKEQKICVEVLPQALEIWLPHNRG